MKVLSYTFAVLALIQSLSAYPITGEVVNCRASPSTNSRVVRTYRKGDTISITCQTEGPSINGNSIWDKTQHKCYVADYYVKTGINGYVTDKCPGTPSTCSAPKLNSASINLIAEFEGFRSKIYLDANGDQTVGYGHKCQKRNCAEVKYPIPLSIANGKKLLADDSTVYEKCVTKMLNKKAKLNANQYGAVVSWAFNTGCPAASSSRLVKRLNHGQSPKTVLPEELIKWIHGNNNRPLDGLRRRRKAEIALSKRATTVGALPVEC